jgi:hypothetical protein
LALIGVALVIDCRPEVHALAGDPRDHLVRVVLADPVGLRSR